MRPGCGGNHRVECCHGLALRLRLDGHLRPRLCNVSIEGKDALLETDFQIVQPAC